MFLTLTFLYLYCYIGNLNQPKYGHLKELHDVLHSMENILTHGNITNINFGNSVSVILFFFFFFVSFILK